MKTFLCPKFYFFLGKVLVIVDSYVFSPEYHSRFLIFPHAVWPVLQTKTKLSVYTTLRYLPIYVLVVLATERGHHPVSSRTNSIVVISGDINAVSHMCLDQIPFYTRGRTTNERYIIIYDQSPQIPVLSHFARNLYVRHSDN